MPRDNCGCAQILSEDCSLSVRTSYLWWVNMTSKQIEVSARHTKGGVQTWKYRILTIDDPAIVKGPPNTEKESMPLQKEGAR